MLGKVEKVAKFVDLYSKIMDMLFKAIRAVLAVALVIMVVVTSIEVVRRYIFGLSFVWAEELVKFLLVSVTFLGGAAAYKAGGMAYLDLLTSHLSESINKIIGIVNNVIIILVCAYLSMQGFAYTFSPMVSRMKSTGLKLNMSFVYISIPIGFSFIILFAIEQILKAVSEKKQQKEEVGA